MPNPYLQIEAGAESKRYELEIGIDDVTIGRSTDCHWVISSGAVSRRHARIKRRAGDITVEDLGSSNGTFVNGERLSAPKTLHDQDAIKFGSVEGHFFAPPATHEADATIAIGGEQQATILAKQPPPTVMIPPPPAESPPEPPKPEAKRAAEVFHAETHPPMPASALQPGTGTHTVVPPPPPAASEAAAPPQPTVAVPPPAATVAVPPPAATVAVPPPGTTVAGMPPTAGAAEPSVPSETSVRPAPSPSAPSQAIARAAATPGAEPSMIELAVIAGASFLVVFGIGAMLIRFVF
jgi:predicted component of type VI protein secretion system